MDPCICKVKEESEKVGLELNIQKKKIMASGPMLRFKKKTKPLECQTKGQFENA